MSLLPKLNLSDVPVEKVRGLNGLAILGELQTKETANGVYINVSVPLFYAPASKEDKENGVSATATYTDLEGYGDVRSTEDAKGLGLSSFTARWNIKPEWFDSQFLEALRNNLVDDKEKISFQMNVAGVTRSLFKALGLDQLDFDLVTPGSIVGFKASASKGEPDKNQIRAFYFARRS